MKPALRTMTVAIAVTLLIGSQRHDASYCEGVLTLPNAAGQCEAVVSTPTWAHWFSGRDTSVSTHFLDVLEMLTRGRQGGHPTSH